jgi:hypothetical protein
MTPAVGTPPLQGFHGRKHVLAPLMERIQEHRNKKEPGRGAEKMPHGDETGLFTVLPEGGNASSKCGRFE